MAAAATPSVSASDAAAAFMANLSATADLAFEPQSVLPGDDVTEEVGACVRRPPLWLRLPTPAHARCCHDRRGGRGCPPFPPIPPIHRCPHAPTRPPARPPATPQVTRAAKRIKLDGGLVQRGEAVKVTRAGTLRHAPPSTYWVDSRTRRYIAADEDAVIGIVDDRSSAAYRLNIWGR